jgi:Ser/Thr protein kinase RdoA (MazF antagonist)
MVETTLPVYRSIASPQTLLEHVLRHYKLSHPNTCQLLAHKHDDLYRIESGPDKFVLRVYAKDSRREDLEAQAHVLEKMLHAKVPVPQVIRGDCGHVLAPEGARYAMLYTHVPGAPAGRGIQPDQASAYGQLVAQLHDVADAQNLCVPLRLDLSYLVDAPVRSIISVLAHRPDDRRWLEARAERLKQAVSNLHPTKPVFGLCHGDLHKSNLLCDVREHMTLIDWDCIGMGWRAYDLAILRWSIGPAIGLYGIGEPRLSEVWRAYLDSYQRVRPLSTDELSALPLFVAIRHLRVMGWEVDRAINGIEGVGVLTEDFFDWWFGGLDAWMKAMCV